MVFGAGGVVQGGGVGAAAVVAEFRGVAASGGAEAAGVDAFADEVALGGADVIGDAIDAIGAVGLGCSCCSMKVFRFECVEIAWSELKNY